jgi:hypothetical protein
MYWVLHKEAFCPLRYQYSCWYMCIFIHASSINTLLLEGFKFINVQCRSNTLKCSLQSRIATSSYTSLTFTTYFAVSHATCVKIIKFTFNLFYPLLFTHVLLVFSVCWFFLSVVCTLFISCDITTLSIRIYNKNWRYYFKRKCEAVPCWGVLVGIL